MINFHLQRAPGLMILISQALMTWYTVFKQLENGCNNAKCVYRNTEIPINLNEYFTIYHFEISLLWKRKLYKNRKKLHFPYSTPSQRLKAWKKAFFFSSILKNCNYLPVDRRRFEYNINLSMGKFLMSQKIILRHTNQV